jgi:hypothetical protein
MGSGGAVSEVVGQHKSRRGGNATAVHATINPPGVLLGGKAFIRLALRAIHLLPQAGEVKGSSPLPLAGEVIDFAKQSQRVRAYPSIISIITLGRSLVRNPRRQYT